MVVPHNSKLKRRGRSMHAGLLTLARAQRGMCLSNNFNIRKHVVAPDKQACLRWHIHGVMFAWPTDVNSRNHCIALRNHFSDAGAPTVRWLVVQQFPFQEIIGQLQAFRKTQKQRINNNKVVGAAAARNNTHARNNHTSGRPRNASMLALAHAPCDGRLAHNCRLKKSLHRFAQSIF